jgi:hypothetical protein
MAKEYDITGVSFDFTKDLAFGEQGEAEIRSFLEALSGGDFEVKTDRYRNGRMVIETQQNPRGITDKSGEKIWVPSGVNVTTAKWWIYIYTLDGSFLIIATDRLKRFLRLNSDKYNEQTKRMFAAASDNPARGFLIMPNEVLDLLTNKLYDKGDNGE